MESSEITRIELRAQILREDERRETFKVRTFEKAINDVKKSAEVDRAKIAKVKELLVERNENKDTVNKLITVKKGIRKIKKLTKSVKEKDSEVAKLEGEKSKLSESLIKLVKVKERLQEITLEKKNEIKNQKENIQLEELSCNKFKEGKENESVLGTDSARSSDYKSQDLILPTSTGINSAEFHVTCQENASRNGHSSDEQPKSENRNKSQLPSFESFRKSLANIESWQDNSGSRVTLSINKDDGIPMQLDVAETGNRNLSINVIAENSNDQRLLWAKKREILKALTETGYKVSKISISGNANEFTK